VAPGTAVHETAIPSDRVESVAITEAGAANRRHPMPVSGPVVEAFDTPAGVMTLMR
jgi:hypothetical protein